MLYSKHSNKNSLYIQKYLLCVLCPLFEFDICCNMDDKALLGNDPASEA
jgi:hypothetical protein